MILPLLTLALASPAAQAQTPLFSNLDAPLGEGGGYLINAAGNQRAVAFTTGSSAYSLTSASAYLFSTSNAVPAVLSFALYTPSTAGGSDPGTLAVSLGTQSVTGSAVYTFTPSSAYTLAANTRYVLLLDYVSGSNGVWVVSGSPTNPTARNGSGYSSPVYRASTDNGASYTTNNQTTLFSVSGSTATAAAPEPGSIALLLTAGVPVIGIVRRRAKSSTS